MATIEESLTMSKVGSFFLTIGLIAAAIGLSTYLYRAWATAVVQEVIRKQESKEGLDKNWFKGDQIKTSFPNLDGKSVMQGMQGGLYSPSQPPRARERKSGPSR